LSGRGATRAGKTPAAAVNPGKTAPACDIAR